MTAGDGAPSIITPKKTKKSAPPKAEPIEEQIRVRREALGISRARLADAADVPVSRVWAAEQPDGGVNIEVRQRIVDVLNAYRDEIAQLPPL